LAHNFKLSDLQEVFQQVKALLVGYLRKMDLILSTLIRFQD